MIRQFFKPKPVEKDSQHAKGEACLNCGTELAGPYCHYCGQPDKRLMVFLPALLREIAEDFFDFDSRFFRTLKPLLFKPGELTSSYIAGRRARYSPPWRLYLISSLLFFLLMAITASFNVQPGSGGFSFAPGNKGDVRITSADSVQQTDKGQAPSETANPSESESSPLSFEEQAALRALEEINQAYTEADRPEPLSAEQADQLQQDIVKTIQRARVWESRDLKFFKDEAWDRETNPLIIPLMPDWFNNWLNDEISRSPEKMEQIIEDPGTIIEQMLDVLPIAIFLLLPIFALLLKVFYLFSRRYYIEHLIFALHNHALIFVIGIVIWSVEFLAGLSNWAWLETMSVMTEVIFLIWLPIYFWIAMYRVYRQNWFLTTVKFLLVGISYLSILMFSTIGVLLIAFLKV